ncbi:hypothetical protein DOE78_11565 [Bacillus sp. Y1]|nr:hypothetical protein [Bacillus sp. Y1]AYA76024.1 hypothetical protein DOE78_11565 [Bacillus sp. Y1]
MEILGGALSLIIGVFVLFFVLGLIVQIFKLFFYLLKALYKLLLLLLKPAVVIGLLYGVFYLFDFLGLIILGVSALIIYIIHVMKQDPLERQIKKIFQTFEMSTISDLIDQLNGNPSYDEVKSIINQLLKDSKLEKLDFGDKEVVYRWTENRYYSKGVVKKTITLQ